MHHSNRRYFQSLTKYCFKGDKSVFNFAKHKKGEKICSPQRKLPLSVFGILKESFVCI